MRVREVKRWPRECELVAGMQITVWANVAFRVISAQQNATLSPGGSEAHRRGGLHSVSLAISFKQRFLVNHTRSCSKPRTKLILQTKMFRDTTGNGFNIVHHFFVREPNDIPT